MLLLFKIPTMVMKIDYRCIARVDAWSKRSASDEEKVATHAKQSLRDIRCLQNDHPLQEALRLYEMGETPASLRRRQWEQLQTESRGTNERTSRQVRRGENTDHSSRTWFPKFLRDKTLDPALKRAMTHWLIHKFPVRYKPN